MVSIARKNLVFDKLRFAIAIVGIVFAVVLITVQAGMFLRFLTNASILIDHIDADLWVTSKNLKNYDFGRPFDRRKYYQVLSVSGVEWAEEFLLGFSFWKRPDGGQESVEIVGYDPRSLVGGPWDVVAGDPRAVSGVDGILLDLADRARLGSPELGQRVEIRGYRARVVGFTRGAKNFTQSPYIFTSLENAHRFSFIGPEQIAYVLVKVAAGEAIPEVQAAIRRSVPYVDVYTRREFSNLSRSYWMVSTGAGVALLSSMLMGLVIGTIIVGQTIYASTIEHLKEFGTLKAIGATNGYVYRIIMQQALIAAVIGYVLGLGVAQLLVRLLRGAGLDVLLPWPVVALIFVLTLLMCLTSSVLSIYRITKIDPALVFKG